MEMLATDFPQEVKACLWSYAIDQIDLSSSDHRLRIIENVLNRGTKAAVDWLLVQFTEKEIADAIRQSSVSEWSKKSLALWSLIFNVVPSRVTRFT
jgi:hypothetical protein